MAGRVIRVIPRTAFDFSYLDKSLVEVRVLVGKIPVAEWTEARLLVRTHNRTISGGSANGQIVVQASLDASTPEDPNHTFVSSAAIANLSVTVDASTEPGEFELSNAGTAIGSMLAIGVVATQDTTTDQGQLYVDISADLILKTPG